MDPVTTMFMGSVGSVGSWGSGGSVKFTGFASGPSLARAESVVAHRFEDLIAWQLSYELQQRVFAFTANGVAARDVKFCDQIRESARSASRNIAEGFGRYYPKEFVRFLRIANGSLNETKCHLRDALDRRYVSPTSTNVSFV